MIRKGCDLIGEYYEKCLGIRLLPCDTRAVECAVSAGSFWEKADSLMCDSIENACVAILCCNERKSINYVCNTYGMGSVKVKNIVRAFNSVVTISEFREEERSAV